MLCEKGGSIVKKIITVMIVLMLFVGYAIMSR